MGRDDGNLTIGKKKKIATERKKRSYRRPTVFTKVVCE